MPLTRTTALLAGLLASAALSLSLLASAGSAQARTASAAANCSGVTLTPSSRTVRRGGQVLLRGSACGATYSTAAAGAVQVKLRKKARWTTIGKAQTDADGGFSVCARVNVPADAKVARVRASSQSGVIASTTLRVSTKGSARCSATGPAPAPATPAPAPAAPAYVPPAPEQGNPDCPLSQPGSDLDFTVPSSCRLVASDTSQNANPLPFWGRIDCQDASRQQTLTTGGDTAPTATGASQGDTSYRRMSVMDGDDYYGERCELGVNDHNGPVAFYREGQRRVTYASFRLPNNFDADANTWQNVLQMKQGQSSDGGGGTPVLSLKVMNGRYSLYHSDAGPTTEDFELWSAPARKNSWTRVAIDANYSQDPDVGWIKTYIDVNGDGDFGDAGEQSPVIHTNTLKYEIGTDASDGLTAGQSIPSHLRVGMYHNASIPCPAATSGCSVEADNIQVVKP